MARMHGVAWALVSVLACGLLSAGPARADAPPEAPAVAQRPPLASDADAAEALKAFKVAFRAKGLRGDEKVAMQAHALRQLAIVQHADVVRALSKETKNRNIDVRTSALLQLGRQQALPARAGAQVLAAMERQAKDDVFTMAGLETIGALGYLGATEKLTHLLKHKTYAVVKHALTTVGELKDVRMIDEILKLMKKLRLEKGAKWDGVSVTYDTGASGDHDQKMAEKLGKAAEAKNKKKGKSAARSMRDLGPVVLEVMKKLTGEEFTGSIEARKWMDAHAKEIKAQQKALDERAKAQ